MAREITLNEGLFVGYTSGAAFQAINILNEEKEFNADSYVVAVFPDPVSYTHLTLPTSVTV